MTNNQATKEKFNNLVKNHKAQDVIILAFETSCDETSVAVVRNGREVLSNVISSQIDIHARFGGVVPEVASRNHLLAIQQVTNQAIEQAGITLQNIDAIAVTYGAGLMGALLVGVSFAKALAFALDIPLLAVNHIWAHISSSYLVDNTLTHPYLALVVSGGHTALVKCTKTKKIVLGTTHDDAVGECYDKVAKVLGLSYPGGPIVDKLAQTGNNNIVFVKKPKDNKNLNFSYSGLKTAVINHIHSLNQKNIPIDTADICASFQHEAIATLVEKCIYAVKKTKIKQLVLAGGVAANSHLRNQIQKAAKEHNFKVVIPPLSLCTDNAAMIGVEAYENLKLGRGLAGLDLNADPSANLKYKKM